MTEGKKNIFVYSIKGYAGAEFRSKLENALKGLHLPCSVREITSLDEFIKARLTSVPAIKIGNIIIRYDQHKPFEDTLKMVVAILNAKPEKASIKHIHKSGV